MSTGSCQFPQDRALWYNVAMHEYPITENIVKMASEHCEDSGGSKVKKIYLVCGENTGYVPDCITMLFEIIAEGTPCEGAHVEIETVKPKLRCSDCGELFERAPYSFRCPKCGGEGLPTDIGKEFYLDRILVE